MFLYLSPCYATAKAARGQKMWPEIFLALNGTHRRKSSERGGLGVKFVLILGESLLFDLPRTQYAAAFGDGD